MTLSTWNVRSVWLTFAEDSCKKEAAKYNADPYVTGMQERSVTLNKQKNIGFLWTWQCCRF